MKRLLRWLALWKLTKDMKPGVKYHLAKMPNTKGVKRGKKEVAE
jgi:hypothetical protein